MKCFYTEYEYDNDKHDMSNVSLGLKQNSCFKVLNTYFIYNKMYGFGNFQLKAYVFNDDTKKAYLELKKSCAVISFLFGIDIAPLERNFYEINNVTISEITSQLTEEYKKTDFITDFSTRINSFQDNKKECFFKCAECYQSAIAFESTSFAKEQFLVLFRIFETIIAHFYLGVGNKALKHDISTTFQGQLNEFIESYFKVKFDDDDLTDIKHNIIRITKNKAKYNIIYILNYYNIPYAHDKILEIVSKRNEITHMKGELFKSDYETNLQEYITIEFKLCRNLIIKYFFDNIDYDKKIKCKIEW